MMTSTLPSQASANSVVRLGVSLIGMIGCRYFEVRSAKVAELKAAEKSPYPHKFHVSISISGFLEKVQLESSACQPRCLTTHFGDID